jgi:hypothetical protein
MKDLNTWIYKYNEKEKELKQIIDSSAVERQKQIKLIKDKNYENIIKLNNQLNEHEDEIFSKLQKIFVRKLINNYNKQNIISMSNITENNKTDISTIIIKNKTKYVNLSKINYNNNVTTNHLNSRITNKVYKINSNEKANINKFKLYIDNNSQINYPENGLNYINDYLNNTKNASILLNN